MKIYKLGLILGLLPVSFAFADCNLKQFRWDCCMKAQTHPNPQARSLVYCGNRPVYLNRKQYETLMRYQRAGLVGSLRLDNEYIDSPCVPAGRYDAN